MMGGDNKFFDDMARMAGGAVNMLSGLQQQIREDVKSRIDEMAAKLDLVPREDLERVEARLAALEKKFAAMAGKPDGRTAMGDAAAAKPAAAKTKAKPAARKKPARG